jgi:site-specific DNA-cytosine methylase
MTPMLTDATIEETKTESFIEQMRGHTMENEKKKQKVALPPELQGKKFRIRKLTERECLRLMDVDDDDIDKMVATGLSKSALYKLAGNSIVVNVLYHIFRKAFIDTDNEQNGQLTLF